MPVGLDVSALLLIMAALLVAGCAIGFCAGFFGIGGGAISVPVFFEVYRLTGNVDDIAMPLAVGTSLAMIIPTSYLSAREHARLGTLDLAVLRTWLLPILVGVICGSVLAGFADAELFQLVFVVVGGVMSTRMLFGGNSQQIKDTLPGRGLLSAYGLGIGLLSALMGIGGGALSTMILTLYGRTIHQAISTSAGVGLLIAVPGAIGYVIAGWGNPELPADAMGYVSLLTLMVVMPAAIMTTRLGARAAHTRSRAQLSRYFGLFLLTVALRFLVAIVFGV
ncbi:sulfite exporter TauE/SafE family protein [Granulosicoccus antarcticus]|uniref:Probable membrane transporter protein n=1 Tax=Granulosicoccus antarcticus IMCC3135 TaxID=1192854 RepID=A0A2Z2NNM2_9GAMM|nr:sulfite exporter TauE/SafE family protein [Granulosicoccus antarcticus]ASJ70430.1 hypothetical protein IMCC3135_01555 [Granulosicoccus antarcticus IMCC3135]